MSGSIDADYRLLLKPLDVVSPFIDPQVGLFEVVRDGGGSEFASRGDKVMVEKTKCLFLKIIIENPRNPDPSSKDTERCLVRQEDLLCRLSNFSAS